jgi:predicted small secreted protein
MLRKIIIVGCLGLMTGLAACSTIAGAGQDLQDTSHWVKRQI